MCAADNRLKDAKLDDNEREEIYDWFHKAMRATTEEKIKEAEKYLCNLGRNVRFKCLQLRVLYTAFNYLLTSENDKLGEYFKKQWFNSKHLWCDFYRTSLFTKGNDTTNRLER